MIKAQKMPSAHAVYYHYKKCMVWIPAVFYHYIIQCCYFKEEIRRSHTEYEICEYR